MKEKLNTENALQRLMELCSRSEKSEHDILQKLRQYDLLEQADVIVEKLREGDFINDLRFAKAFVHDKYKFNKWGLIKIRYLLRLEKIKEHIVDQALDEIDTGDYRKMVMNELDKKKDSLRRTSPQQLKSKIYAFALQRGYESEIIVLFINNIKP